MPNAPAPPPPAYKWKVVAMLWFICFFNYADRQAISAVFPKLQQEFGFDKVQLGLIGSAFMYIYAAGAPFAGLVCDRFRRKDLILGGCLFWSFVTITTGWCSKLWHFITVRALEGFGETFYFPASMSLTSDYHGPRTRSKALSFHQSSVYIGTILGSWAGAWFAVNYGWRTGFYVFGGLGMLLALALYAFLREPARGESEAIVTTEKLTVTETFRLVLRAPKVPYLMLAFVAANFVATIFLVWTPTFLVEKFGFKLTAAGLSGTIFIHLASAFSVPIAGILADRLSRRFANGRIIVQAAGLIVGATFVFMVGHTKDKTTLLIAMSLFGICKGFYDSGIFASLYDQVEPRARGTAAGLMNTIGWGAGALGPLYAGLASKYGNRGSEMENMSAAISWCGAVYILGAAFLVGAILTKTRHGAPALAGSPPT
jgi:MFS family permease